MSNNIVEYYKALSNPIRLTIFLHIAKESEGFVPSDPTKESCVTEISKTLNLPQPTVSNHLKVLKKAGLVQSLKGGTNCYHYVTKQASTELLSHSQYVFSQAHKNPY